MIWSPRVPVFRDDVSLGLVEEVIQTNQTTLFDQVALVNMVTSCAVNLGHYKRQGGAESTAEAEMRRRIELVVRLAASQGSQVQVHSSQNVPRCSCWVPGAVGFSSGLQALSRGESGPNKLEDAKL